MSVWKDPEAINLLRARAEAGDSAGQIAAALCALGFLVSRSAVIGKMRRAGIALMGMPTRPQSQPDGAAASIAVGKPLQAMRPPAQSASAVAFPPRPAEGRPAISPAPVGMIAAASFSPTPEAPAATSPLGGVPLIGLPSDCCRWPVSGERASLRVCGGLATRGAYCAAHGRLAYQPLTLPLRTPSDATARRMRAEERETDLVALFGEAV